MTTTKFIWPGHDEALDGPQHAVGAVDAFKEYGSAGISTRSRALFQAIFETLTPAQQERAVLHLGFVVDPSTPALAGSVPASDAPAVTGEKHSGSELNSTTPPSALFTGANDPQQPGLSPDRAREHADRVQGALEGSHIAQWETLRASAENFGGRVWVDGSGFGIQAGDGGMWKKVATLFELRAALSDWVAHERSQGRDPHPPQTTEQLLANVIVTQCQRAGMVVGDEIALKGEALIDLVQQLGDALYQHELEAAHRGPVQSITFTESDGTERLIVWENGDQSVGILSGYRADDNLWEQRAEHKELVGALKGMWSSLDKSFQFNRKAVQREIERQLDRLDPQWRTKKGSTP